jgi:hypothetical protein
MSKCNKKTKQLVTDRLEDKKDLTNSHQNNSKECIHTNKETVLSGLTSLS